MGPEIAVVRKILVRARKVRPRRTDLATQKRMPVRSPDVNFKPPPDGLLYSQVNTAA